jgi:hypothetical protein
MSYAMRDDNPTFGALAAVEYPNGAAASTIGCIQNFEPIEFLAQSSSTIPASSFNTVFIAPPGPSVSAGLPALGAKYQIAGVSVYYHAAGAAGSAVSFEVVPAGTADGSGNNILSATNFALNTAQSNTPFNLTLNTNVDNLTVLPGGRININFNSTSVGAGLADLAIIIYLLRTA